MSFLRQILTVGSGSMMAQVLTVATMPVLSRLYSPTAYAGWALLMSVTIIFTSVATLRYELAIVLPSTHEEAANVMAVCAFVTIAMSIIAGCLLPLSWGWLLGKGFYRELNFWLWSVPLLIVATGVYMACNTWLVRTKEFGWYSISQVGLPFLTIFCQILVALLGINSASGLIIGTIFSQCSLVALLLILISSKYGHLILRSISRQEIRNSLNKYRMYPFYMTPYTLIGTIRDRLVYFLLGYCGAKSDVGFYNISSRLVNMPNNLVSSAIRPVFFQKAARSQFISLEVPINRAMMFLAVCIIPFWILFLFHAKTLFAFIFGEPWREAGLYAAILSIPAIPLLLGNWLDRSFDVLGKQRLAFILESVFSSLSIFVLSMGALVFNNVLIAICLQAGIMTIYYSYWIIVLFNIASFDTYGLLKLIGLISLVGIGSIIISWLLLAAMPLIIAIVLNGVIASLGVLAYIYVQWNELKMIV